MSPAFSSTDLGCFLARYSSGLSYAVLYTQVRLCEGHLVPVTRTEVPMDHIIYGRHHGTY